MRIRHQFAGVNEPAKRLLHQFFAIVKVIEYFPTKNHEPAVHARAGPAHVLDAFYRPIRARRLPSENWPLA